MRKHCRLFMALLACNPGTLSQDSANVIKSEAVSAFVWGEDTTSGALSSTIQDPVTGKAIHTLRYEGVQVSSRVGFERASDGLGIYLNYTSIIVNATDSPVSVRYGSISVDGRTASLLSLVPPSKKPAKKESENNVEQAELASMHCFSSGFLSGEAVFSASLSSRAFTVASQTALTVSTAIRDPRGYQPLRCSVEGCHPTGTMRYDLNVDGKDYVFVWPGNSAIYCGK